MANDVSGSGSGRDGVEVPRHRRKRTAPVEKIVCPVCGMTCDQVKCKVVCPRCRTLVYNCSEF